MSRYLLVDDSPTIRLALAAALRNVTPTRVEIVEAATEREAVERFMGGAFDAVFLDMMLENGRSSLDVLRAILAAKPDAHVILMTGLEREHPDVVAAVSLGAFGYLRKPVRTADVRDALDQIAAEQGSAGRIR